MVTVVLVWSFSVVVLSVVLALVVAAQASARAVRDVLRARPSTGPSPLRHSTHALRRRPAVPR
jgi:hypothetical protein